MDTRTLVLACCIGIFALVSGCASVGSPSAMRQTFRPPFSIGLPEQYEPPVMPEDNSPPRKSIAD